MEARGMTFSEGIGLLREVQHQRRSGTLHAKGLSHGALWQPKHCANAAALATKRLGMHYQATTWSRKSSMASRKHEQEQDVGEEKDERQDAEPGDDGHTPSRAGRRADLREDRAGDGRNDNNNGDDTWDGLQDGDDSCDGLHNPDDDIDVEKSIEHGRRGTQRALYDEDASLLSLKTRSAPPSP